LRHHAIGSGSGSGAGGVRCHSTEGVAEERRGGGSRKRKRFPLQVEDDAKSVLDWEVATLVGNKNGCQINGELVDGCKERDKTTYLDIKIEHDLEIGPTFPSKQPYTNPIPAQFSFEGAEPVPMPMDPNVTLSKGQCPSSLAEIVKTKNLPCREGIGPETGWHISNRDQRDNCRILRGTSPDFLGSIQRRGRDFLGQPKEACRGRNTFGRHETRFSRPKRERRHQFGQWR